MATSIHRLALQQQTSLPISTTFHLIGLLSMTNDYTQIIEAFDLITQAFERDQKRHLMDQHIPISMQHLLEEQIIPQMQQEIDYDPTPQTAYDFFH